MQAQQVSSNFTTAGSGSLETSHPQKRDSSTDYVPRLQLLLHEIDHRYVAPQSSSTDFLNSHHDWIHNTVGPLTSWTTKKLNGLEDSSFAVIHRSYPFADTEMQVLLGKLTALAILLDDSLDDDAIYDEMAGFAHRVYINESHSSEILNLYHECIKELSHAHEGDAVLRGLAVTPWINYVDACLLEKRLLTVDPKLRASPYDMGYHSLAKRQHPPARETSPGAVLHFPVYLRHKTGIGEAYAAATFKANKKQELPLSRYIMALPDMIFHIEVLNDLLSFHKEELAGETANLIHLRTKSLQDYYKRTSPGDSREWTVSDTFNLLCDEVRDATYRVDEVLRLSDCERMTKEELEEAGLSDADVAIALQWRGWRDGYISWHLESQRYKLDFIRPKKFQTN